MFILRDKIRQNLRKYYNTIETKKRKKEEKRDNLLQVFVFPKTTITNYKSQCFFPFEVHFFVKFNIFQALLFSSCFIATTDAEWVLLIFSFLHVRRLKFCVATVYILEKK